MVREDVAGSMRIVVPIALSMLAAACTYGLDQDRAFFYRCNGDSDCLQGEGYRCLACPGLEGA
ncbi:MAG: hypothetical protein FJ125_03165, partial [Deltaproteobacteria bacterium]|nr:hypothetical protein [Deltaproteobacteria bacterium]